jgi:hypothetical protein
MAHGIAIITLTCCLAACGGNGSLEGDADSDVETDVPEEGGPDTTDEDVGLDPDVLEDTAGDPPEDGAADITADPGEDVPADVEPDGPVVGSCTGWPSSADSYSFAQAARLDSAVLPDFSGTAPSCCRDFGTISADYIESGTHLVDNALGELLDALAGMGMPSFDDEMADAISEGRLIILFDHQELDGRTDTDGFCLVRFDGTPDTSSGYLALRDGFVTGSGTPLETFPASMVAGAMVAGPGSFVMPVPLTAALLLPFEDVELTGSATLGSSGVSYSGGTFSGYVTLEELLEAYNDFIQTNCSCLSPPDPVFVRESTGSITNRCTDLDSAACLSAGNDLCYQIGSTCFTLVGILPMTADLETDSSMTGYDAYSFGFEWTAVPANISGLSP